jgi:hypothetical protein
MSEKKIIYRDNPFYTARLLRMHRQTRPQGTSTTKAGSLLKQQIPIRTFTQWNEAQPGFVGADLVAHCEGHLEGGRPSRVLFVK